MISINVPIPAKGKHCMFCMFRSETEQLCGIFIGETLHRDKKNGWLLRCQGCLHAEVHEITLQGLPPSKCYNCGVSPIKGTPLVYPNNKMYCQECHDARVYDKEI